MKHTKGPWKLIGKTVVELPDIDHGLFSFIGNDFVLHQVNLTNEEAEANAKLIASAPELLEALKCAHQYAKAWQIKETDPLVGDFLERDVLMIESAIQKATT